MRGLELFDVAQAVANDSAGIFEVGRTKAPVTPHLQTLGGQAEQRGGCPGIDDYISGEIVYVGNFVCGCGH
jgi:hypothetical protein